MCVHETILTELIVALDHVCSESGFGERMSSAYGLSMATKFCLSTLYKAQQLCFGWLKERMSEGQPCS